MSFRPVSLMDATPVDTLDLHGHSVTTAPKALESFLRRQHRGTVVHIITGRGRGSKGRPVLRPLVARLLREQLNAMVEEFSKDLDEGGFLVRRR